MKSLEPFLENLTRLISLRQSTSLSVIVQDYLSETGTTETTVGFDPDFFFTLDEEGRMKQNSSTRML